jgi:hypothetical protein
MARDGVNVWVEAGPEFTRVANALRDMDTKAPSRFRAALKKAATPIVQDVRAAALALPARKGKHTGLRTRLAKGVGVQAGVGKSARMRIVTKMPAGEEALPRGEDSGAQGWRHPVFGNTDNWVNQAGGSWFRETIADDQDFLEERVNQVLQDARDQIAAAGGNHL